MSNNPIFGGFGVVDKIQTKYLIPLAAGFDVPTATIEVGKRGETVLNGGLGQITGIAGPGNNYKSMFLHYMALRALDIIKSCCDLSTIITYDTEVNMVVSRLESFARYFRHINYGIISSGNPCWLVTDKSKLDANDFIINLNSLSKAKEKDKKIDIEISYLKDVYTGKPLRVKAPTFVQVDSLSEFEGKATVEMLTNNDLEGSDTNTFAMKQGLYKTKFLSQLPRLTAKSNIFMLFTAHIGKKIDMATGPAKYKVPTRDLQYLKAGDVIKGISPKSYYLMNNFWFAHSATLLVNPTSKLPEYPFDNKDTQGTDLNLVKLSVMRSKHGPSGHTLEVIVSQNDGVQPDLTHFRNIKKADNYGIEGSNISYNSVFMPDVKLSRTTIRKKLMENDKLKVAMQWTSELLQLYTFMPNLRREGILCTPKELYEDIKAKGYDWDKLLDSRPYPLPNNYQEGEKPYLGILDLCKMRNGDYHPYWYGELNNDKHSNSV